MVTATIRDLRTRFPVVRKLVEQEGEVVVTHRGRPVIVLRAYEEQPASRRRPVHYWDRLRRRMPRPLTAATRRALDEVNRGER